MFLSLLTLRVFRMSLNTLYINDKNRTRILDSYIFSSHCRSVIT
ncbi:hypothetical protein PPSIR1_17620 [Plesiocystis pacifica SIR-1]|uniref:Uncharacterized protein n=1 Tax=Plesiocystis pacifica SIR-1 TaxID=391625 RepID=A6GIW5_9BACT|nr:hypothetical protein PPSIR1_17620 [Plesiocystis pacifica SIR-1]